MSIFDIFDKISNDTAKNTGTPEYIIAGLGNFGMEFDNTRHNAGFEVVDRLAGQYGTTINRMQFKGKTAVVDIEGFKCLLLKPTTYMNKSGESIVQAMDFYKLDVDNLIVVCDDISIDCGKIRIRRKGSHGGHNGLRNIIDLTGRDDFLRIKVGVGKKPHPDYDLAKWVLGKFRPADMEKMKISTENACEALKLMVLDETEEAMNRYN
ncbi:MAG: aminoacyl-tRNA hydrolase [Ruminococcus sp.]|nr:aminoacyl-tRNA hydrolase [Ruminococcus sp.]